MQDRLRMRKEQSGLAQRNDLKTFVDLIDADENRGRGAHPTVAGVVGTCLIGCVILGALAGCSWTDQHGTHHLIVGVGFGLVTTTNRPGVDVYDSRVLGALAGPDGAGVGWMRHHRVKIDPALASNVVVSVQATPGRLTVKNFDPFATNPNATVNAHQERKPDK